MAFLSSKDHSQPQPHHFTCYLSLHEVEEFVDFIHMHKSARDIPKTSPRAVLWLILGLLWAAPEDFLRL